MSAPLIDHISRDRLVALGRLVFGDRWQTKLARALYCSDRAVRMWAAGDRPVPRTVEKLLLQWLDLEAGRLLRLRRAIRRGEAGLPP